ILVNEPCSASTVLTTKLHPASFWPSSWNSLTFSKQLGNPGSSSPLKDIVSTPRPHSPPPAAHLLNNCFGSQPWIQPCHRWTETQDLISLLPLQAPFHSSSLPALHHLWEYSSVPSDRRTTDCA
ncbi:hypothetical protein ATANTOWER_020577, partial [Ataeniobius toweri]|nr:hypothetical protein [Ataeniobius toweri]